tara:strand:- start:1040 stop:1522 length:483 start_codon:yes stop_codon:yes gene_type:complete
MSNAAPIVCPEQEVIAPWIDYNGHLNMAYYHVIFDRSVDYFYDMLGIGEGYARRGLGSVFTMEVHVHYLNGVSLGDRLQVHLQLLDFDQKCLHFFQHMYLAEGGHLVATSEQLALHVDMASRRSAPFPEGASSALADIAREHALLERPERSGSSIGIRRR